MKKAAVLLTCYNRVETTLKCLAYFFAADKPDSTCFDIYLVDDGSPDQTGKIVKEAYPLINVIEGTGDLYWTKGMKLAWDIAVKNGSYDFFLWLNDDVILEKEGIINIFNDYKFVTSEKKKEAVISGICRWHERDEVSYGGKNKKRKKIIPNGMPQECLFMNGNLVLIPYRIYKNTGSLSPIYPHGGGDCDYGLRVLKHDFLVYVTSCYVAKCDRNPPLLYRNKNFNVRKRLKALYLNKKGNIMGGIKFHYIHFGFVAAFCCFLYRNYKCIFAPD